MRFRRSAVALAALALAASPASLLAQSPDSVTAYTAAECPPCAEWNAPQRPFRIHGNTWYVGTGGLSAILITSPRGHVLIDGGLPESAPLIADNIRALGFRLDDVKLIANSHAHYDHAGGIAMLQRWSGAEVAALPWSAAVMRTGLTLPEDPQQAVALPYPAVARVREIAPGDTLRVGPLAVVAHRTAGHTPSGTTWSWRSCEDGTCADIVYADSQTPVSADEFLFTRSAAYPDGIRDFEQGFALLERLSCDILLTPHPGFTQLFERLTSREGGAADAFMKPPACDELVASSRARLARRIADEQKRGG